MTLKPIVEYDGQPYVDDPVLERPKSEFTTPIAASVSDAFGNRIPQPLQTGYERVKLRWMKPGPDGKLVPR